MSDLAAGGDALQDGPAERAARLDTGEVYERVRQRFVATVVGLSDERLRTCVPASPDWSVHDVVGHVVGLAADLNAQRFPAPGDSAGAAWMAAQVERGRSRTIRELVDEWDAEAPAFEEVLRVFGYELGSHFVGDLHVHFQDVRAALSVPPDREPLTVAVALDHYAAFADVLLTTERWGTVEVVTEQETRVLGTEDGPRRAVLRAPQFEVLRLLAGRRSARQIRNLDWQGDVDGVLQLLRANLTVSYRVPEVDLAD